MKLMQNALIMFFPVTEMMLFFPPLILKAESIKATFGKSLCLQNRQHMESKSLSPMLGKFIYFPIFLLFKKKEEENK